jgi:hypothetical protein
VFIIVDNGSDHRGQAAIDRLRKAHPNAVMVHTPVHASWLNQGRDLLLGNPEESGLPEGLHQLGQLSATRLAFVDRYNKTAKPFGWKYTTADLKDLLHRISEHGKRDTRQLTSLTTAA